MFFSFRVWDFYLRFRLSVRNYVTMTTVEITEHGGTAIVLVSASQREGSGFLNPTLRLFSYHCQSKTLPLSKALPRDLDLVPWHLLPVICSNRRAAVYVTK